MSKSAVIIDTGPLVAFLVRTDLHHAWADREFQSLPKPFVTCEPVLAETAFLLSRLAHGPRRLFDLLEAGALTVQFSVVKERVALQKSWTNTPICQFPSQMLV